MNVETKEILWPLPQPGLNHALEAYVLHLTPSERVVNTDQRHGWLHRRFCLAKGKF